jgi:hypothetical protein
MALSGCQMKFKKVNTIERSQPFFGQYHYCISFYLPNANVLRDLDPIKVLKSIQQRNAWAPATHYRLKISEEEQHDLIQVCDYLLARSHPFKRTVSTNSVYLYTNHPTDFQNLNGVGGLIVTNHTQVNVSLQSNAVTLKNPRHKYRTFFRERWLRDYELKNIREYFLARPDQFRLSPGFELLVNGRRMWLMANYFVDHNEPQADLLINMAVPGVVKKTLPIVARN